MFLLLLIALARRVIIENLIIYLLRVYEIQEVILGPIELLHPELSQSGDMGLPFLNINHIVDILVNKIH